MGVVMHDGHPYSMPPDAIGCRARCISIAIACDRRGSLQCRARAEIPARRRLDPARASRPARRRGLGQAGPALFAASASAGSRRRRLAYLTELTSAPADLDSRRRAAAPLLQTHGDAALRRAFARPRRAGDRRRAHRALSRRREPRPPVRPGTDRPPTIAAPPLPRGGRVQVAEGARRGGAQRSTWTRPSTAVRSRRVGGRS